MKIGILSNHPAEYTNAVLAKLCRARGWECVVIDPRQARFVMDARGVRTNLPELDALVTRCDNDVMTRHDASFKVLGHYEARAIPIVNGRRAIVSNHDKVLNYEALSRGGVKIPKTCFVSSVDAARDAIAEEFSYPVVVKGIFGTCGREVHLAHNEAELEAAFQRYAGENHPVLLQEFLSFKDHEGRVFDYRAIVSRNRAGRASGCYVVRYARPGDFRATYSLGGTSVRPARYREDVLEIAFRALEATGADILGVDVAERDGELFVLEGNSCYYHARDVEEKVGNDVWENILEGFQPRAHASNLQPPGRHPELRCGGAA